ncbi:MAG: hypothetical protein KRP56_07840 [Candidatus Methanogranum gryphiswaldense]|jgi:hypothetical protein|nr:MAG: hypothetical protein KRP56_07840 [Candidatus Methanogranum sp. U3.2.1]
MVAFALVFVAGASLVTNGSDASANGVVELDDSTIEIEGTVDATILFDVSDTYEQIEITYTAKLVNSSGTTQSSAVSPSSGSLSPGVKETLTITAPDTAGTYRLVVVFTYTLDEGSSQTETKEAILKVVEPITLSIDITNNSDVDLTKLLLDFYVDGVKVNDDPVEATVASGETTTVTYDYAVDSISTGAHTFKVVVSDDSLIVNKITGLGEDHTFYVGHSSYGWLNILMAIFLIIIVIMAVYIYRKPVKNYGKPKSRR